VPQSKTHGRCRHHSAGGILIAADPPHKWNAGPANSIDGELDELILWERIKNDPSDFSWHITCAS
jgi:hypothetical protein